MQPPGNNNTPLRSLRLLFKRLFVSSSYHISTNSIRTARRRAIARNPTAGRHGVALGRTPCGPTEDATQMRRLSGRNDLIAYSLKCYRNVLRTSEAVRSIISMRPNSSGSSDFRILLRSRIPASSSCSVVQVFCIFVLSEISALSFFLPVDRGRLAFSSRMKRDPLCCLKGKLFNFLLKRMQGESEKIYQSHPAGCRLKAFRL